jgi:hypothetical protein
MTPDAFRGLALAFPEAIEGSHMGHPDFRVRGKIFATLYPPGKGLGMVKLTPEQQARWVEEEPRMFAPVKGGWGERGATNVILKAARKGPVRRALMEAWRNVAPKVVVAEFEG